MSWAKLFSSITESSLWGEQKEVRLLFVSMLARADATGFVEAALPGLCRLSNLSQEETERAIAVLESPDPHSKNPNNEGRRVLKVPGGWMILNYEDYRNRRGEEERREYMRDYMKRYRRKQDVNLCKLPVNTVNHGKPPLAQAEAEAEAEAVKNPNPTLSHAKKRKTRELLPDVELSERGKRMATWFKRRHSTPWTDKERKLFLEAVPSANDEDFEILATYYTKPKQPGHFPRQSLVVLLNNWLGELDRARMDVEKADAAPKRLSYAP